MSDETTPKPDEKKPDPPPPYVTKAELETMLQAQAQQFAGLIQRVTETITAPKPAKGDDERKVVDFYNQPEKAAEALFEAKMAPVREAYVLNEKQRQLAEVAALPHAAEYMEEIKQVIASTPPLAQIQPGFAKEAYNLVIGRHFDDVRKKAAEKEATKPEFTETATAGAPAGRKSDRLTADEMQAAAGMGLSEDDYKKWRDKPEEMAKASLAAKRSA